MDAVLVDSDIVIEVLRNRNSEIRESWEALSEAAVSVAYSPVTAAEIWHGARPPESSPIERLFSALACIPIDAEIGRQAGNFMRRFRPSHGLELGDALIAATASLHGLRLWTRNRKHYPMRDVQFYLD